MLKPITAVMGARLMDLDRSQTLGEIVNWVIDPNEKKISALMVKPAGFFSRILAISTLDIVEYGPKMVIVKNQQALVSPNELVHVSKLMRHHRHVIGNPVVTQSGKQLGVVEDILFETSDSTIQKIYVQPGILGILRQSDLIIGADKIFSIEPKRIVITENGSDWKTIEEAAPASVAH